MNKKVNTLIFVLAGTVLNIVVMLVLLFALIALTTQLLRNVESDGVKTAVFFVCVLGSIVGSFFIYSRLIRWVNKKWNLDQYIDPIFRRKRP